MGVVQNMTNRYNGKIYKFSSFQVKMYYTGIQKLFSYFSPYYNILFLIIRYYNLHLI